MPLRLGMLGMWHVHADGMVKQIAAHPDEFQLVGGFDPEPAVVQQRQSAWKELVPAFQWHNSAADLLGEKLDGIVVEGRVWENIKWASMALEAGRPVLLEKPAGENLAEFQQLIELAQRKRLHVQLIYLFRYMSAMQELQRRAREGELGQIYALRARLPKDIRDYADYVQDLERYPGGIFFEMAGHLVDLLISLMGRPKSVTPFLAHHYRVPGTFIDNGVSVFEMDSGWGIIEVPALEVAPHSRRIEVYGTEGACVIPHVGSGHLGNRHVQPLEVFRKGRADWDILELPATALQIGDLREFAAVVTNQKTPDFSNEHDLLVQEMLLRASGML
jgi:predicted dehydrogenase